MPGACAAWRLSPLGPVGACELMPGAGGYKPGAYAASRLAPLGAGMRVMPAARSSVKVFAATPPCTYRPGSAHTKQGSAQARCPSMRQRIVNIHAHAGVSCPGCDAPCISSTACSRRLCLHITSIVCPVCTRLAKSHNTLTRVHSVNRAYAGHQGFVLAQSNS